MERELWNWLYVVVRGLDSGSWGGYYRPGEIVLVFLWAVVHDRPTRWACVAAHWESLPPFPLPSQSTMSRRLRTPAVQQLWRRLEVRLGADPSLWKIHDVDSKPLPVGPCSKDRDAKCGYVRGGRARGYRIHVVWGRGAPIPSAWDDAAMNAGDPTVARRLVRNLPGQGYLVGDSAYDSNALHEAVGPQRQLVAPPKRRGRGLGHRRHHPGRLRCLALLETCAGQELLHGRGQIERQFAGLTSFGGGLGPLPAWVRTPPRVHAWVQAKLIVNAARILRRRQPMLLAPA